MEITVRHSPPGDRSWQLETARQAWLSGYTHIYPVETINALFDGALPQAASWEARRGTPKIESLEAACGPDRIGYLTYAPMLDPGLVEVRSLYVAPGFQSMGVGRALWLSAEESALALGASEIEVWTLSKGPAVRFYLGCGCVLAGEGEFSIGEQSELALCLRKVLGPSNRAR